MKIAIDIGGTHGGWVGGEVVNTIGEVLSKNVTAGFNESSKEPIERWRGRRKLSQKRRHGELRVCSRKAIKERHLHWGKQRSVLVLVYLPRRRLIDE